MKENKYSTSIAQAITTFLTEDDWHFTFDEKRGVFKFGLSISGKIKNISYRIDVQNNDYVVYAISPIGADENDREMMASIAEFVCRANYGLVNGNFELDMRDGELRFKCFVDCDGITPSNEIVRNSIYCPAAMFKRYSDGIVNIIFTRISAKEAVEICEKPAMTELSTLLSELKGCDDEIDDIIAQFATQFGITDSEQPENKDDEPVHIKTDLFGTEGVE